MQDDKKKPGRLWAGLGLGALAVLGVTAISASEPASSTSATNTYESVQVAPLPRVEATQSVSAQVDDAEPVPARAGLSNDNYYTNVAGNQVHSPAYADTSCEAAGASAECRDGTCSFSQNRRGTCSHHGGVARWIY